MKKLMVMLGIVALGLAAVAQPLSYFVNETTGCLTFWIPETYKFDLYQETGYGLEVQYRNWTYDPIGLALSLGLARWEANSDSKQIFAADMSDASGTLTLIPVGGSLVYRLVDWTEWGLIAEAGVRYVLTQSNMDFLRTLPDRRYREEMDIKNGWVGVLGLDYERLFSNGWTMFLGMSYQMDIQTGRIEVNTGHLQDNELQALFFKVGTTLTF